MSDAVRNDVKGSSSQKYLKLYDNILHLCSLQSKIYEIPLLLAAILDFRQYLKKHTWDNVGLLEINLGHPCGHLCKISAFS